MVGRQGRGKADLMKQRGENRYTILDNVALPPVCRVLTPGAW
ncbi:organic solvent tolerance protein [Escherichia coli]|uniref:Organic solvent tolerance protein n=1 Tax=Escherichia coli TaxID=562 RepID=A0A2X1NC84_ECOLX|nr:organic solvent tolerance protein [Escherichia coli]